MITGVHEKTLQLHGVVRRFDFSVCVVLNHINTLDVLSLHCNFQVAVCHQHQLVQSSILQMCYPRTATFRLYFATYILIFLLKALFITHIHYHTRVESSLWFKALLESCVSRQSFARCFSLPHRQVPYTKFVTMNTIPITRMTAEIMAGVA